MLSALIPSRHSYPALALGRTTGTPEVRFSRSSRTEENSPSNILTPTSDRDRQYCYIRKIYAMDHTFLLISAYRYVVRTVSYSPMANSGVQSLKILSEKLYLLIFVYDIFR